MSYFVEIQTFQRENSVRLIEKLFIKVWTALGDIKFITFKEVLIKLFSNCKILKENLKHSY